MNGFKGKTIAITRPKERAEVAVKIIEAHGGVALVAPTLELRSTRTESLMELCNRAGELDWVIFTSPASLESLFTYCANFKEKLNPECQVAVIGPKTARSLEEFGLQAKIMPDEYTAEGLLDIFNEIDLEGKKIGLPRTFSARDVLPDGLRDMGAEVLLAEAYKSTLPYDQKKVQQLIDGIIKGKVDAVTFTSPLTVTNLFEIAGGKKEELIDALRHKNIITAAIGPITELPLKGEGIEAVIPSKYTVKAMIEKLMEEMS